MNGYIDWRFNKRNLVELTMTYTSQGQPEAWDSVVQPLDNRVSNSARQHFVLPHLFWHSDLASGLKNELQATYIHAGYTSGSFQSGSTYGNLYGDAFDSTYEHPTSYHLLLWDRLEYRGRIGHVDVEPALNISYEYGRDKDSLSGSSGDIPSSGGLGATEIYSAFYEVSTLTSKPVLVTPAIDLTYKRAFDLGGGVLIEAGHQHGPGNRQGFPFVSLMVDPLRMVKENGRSSLRLFGSYAQRTETSAVGYSLTDLADGPSNLNLGGLVIPNNGISGFGGGGIYIGDQKPPVYWVGEAGASFAACEDRLLIQYNFERRNYSTGVLIPSYVANTVLFAEVNSALHHVDIRVKILDGPGMRWLSDVSLTLLRNSFGSVNVDNIPVVAIGDVAPSAWSETVGWVNRIQVKGFTAGLDRFIILGRRYWCRSIRAVLIL